VSAPRWATFDCYGTLVDWNGGISAQLARLWPDADAAELLERYHEIEPRVELDGNLPYSEVLTQTLRLLADSEGLDLAATDERALAESLPSWPAFAEVPGELAALRERGWKLAILSNTDPDYIAASQERIDVPFDQVVVASEIGSYKPALGHWRTFEERVGRLPDVHVAASLFHDVAPANELGLPSIWINRLGETPGPQPTRELPDLTRLADTLEELA